MPKKPKPIPPPANTPSRASFISRGTSGEVGANPRNLLLTTINPLLGKSSKNVGRPSLLSGA